MFIRKEWLGQGTIRNEQLIPGRVQRVIIQRGMRRLIVWNVHNHCLARADLEPVLALLKSDHEAAVIDGVNTSVWVLGDLNLQDTGDRAVHLDGTGVATHEGGACYACGAVAGSFAPPYTHQF